MIDAIIANDLQAAARLEDPNESLDDRGASALFFACTEAMVRALLARRADPLRTLRDGTSVIDAAAHEGDTAIVRTLLEAAPELATESRALLAADHPEAEALIRAVARSGKSGLDAPLPTRSTLHARAVEASSGPGVPPFKGSQRYPTSVPESVRCEHVPPVPFPYVHAIDARGAHGFFGYGQTRAIGVELETGKRIFETGSDATFGTPGGHMYPAQIGIAGEWAAIATIERIHLVPFGSIAKEPAQWFTCQLGTCAAGVLGGRILIVGARAGGAIFGVSGKRIARLAELEASAFETMGSPLDMHLRMALRVSGEGHDDIRRLRALPEEDGVRIVATGAGGFDTKSVHVRGWQLDAHESSSAASEIVDAFEHDGTVRIRTSTIGQGDVREFVLEDLEALWKCAFAPRARRAKSDHFEANASPLPKPYPAPHRDVGTLAYPVIAKGGFAYGHRVSPSPGFWHSFIVDEKGAHPLRPQWLSGVTFKGFHPKGATMLAATGRQVIEIDLRTRRWKERTFAGAVSGVSYFESRIAVLHDGAVEILERLDAATGEKLPLAKPRHAELACFHGGRVLWIPVGEDGNVFIARKSGKLVVVGVVRACAGGYELSPEGDFLNTGKGALHLTGWKAAIASARPWAGESLDDIAQSKP